MENKHTKSQSSSTNSFWVVGILSRTRNLHNFRKLAKTTESTKFEMVITLTELQPYGLTCVVILICGLTGKCLNEFKNLSATRLGWSEMECPFCKPAPFEVHLCVDDPSDCETSRGVLHMVSIKSTCLDFNVVDYVPHSNHGCCRDPLPVWSLRVLYIPHINQWQPWLLPKSHFQCSLCNCCVYSCDQVEQPTWTWLQRTVKLGQMYPW